jgi:hypothetical protein
MKKLLILLLAACIFSAHAISQPVIEESGIAAAGTISGKVWVGGAVVPGAPGINETWDFSTVGLVQTNTMSFVNPSGTPYGSSFPASNYCLVLDSAGIGNHYTYYIHSSGKLETIGDSITATSGYNYSPNPKTELEFPFHFLDYFTDDWQRTDDSSGSVAALYDAYGTLLTPFGEFTNVVRLNYNDGATQKYVWYNINPIYPIWTYVPADSSSVVINLNPVGIESENAHDPVEIISPVPAHNQLNIYLKEMVTAGEVSVHVYNLVGKEVNSFAMRINNPQSVILDIRELPEGIYLLDVALPGQHLLRKFIVE